MEEYIPGHTGILEYKEEGARYIARHNKFKKNMRAYKCKYGDHWHVTSMSKGRFYTLQRRDPKPSDRRPSRA